MQNCMSNWNLTEGNKSCSFPDMALQYKILMAAEQVNALALHRGKYGFRIHILVHKQEDT